MAVFIKNGILYNHANSDWHIASVQIEGMTSAVVAPESVNWNGNIVVSNNTAHFEIGCSVYHCIIGNETDAMRAYHTAYSEGWNWAGKHTGTPRRGKHLGFYHGVESRRQP